MIKTTRFLPALLLQSPLPLMWTSEWMIAWTYHTDKTQISNQLCLREVDDHTDIESIHNNL